MTGPVDPIAVALSVAQVFDTLGISRAATKSISTVDRGSPANELASDPPIVCRRDVLGIIRVQGARLDRDYLAVNAPVLGVADLLARALLES